MERSDSFGYWLRRRRKARDLTQQELADQAGCAAATIRRIEADERRPSKALANHLADVLVVATSQRAAFLLAARGEGRVDQLELATSPLAAAPAATLDARPHNLPAPPNALIGRERETAALCEQLRRPHSRLVTLTGPGGTGKTRLALQVAAALLDDFLGGVWFVDLAPVGDPQLVLGVVGRALGLRDGGTWGAQEHLVACLQGRRLLLVLDNFEHLLDAAPQLAALLAALTELQLLVTSRAALHLRAEHEYPVPPLALPEPAGPASAEWLGQYDAVKLFAERARAVRPDFLVSDNNALAIAALCTRLDGLPLAIELAAARLRLFAPATLLARLGDRLELLVGGARDLPARQQSMRSTIDWSYRLLGRDEQLLFARLGVFAGGWTLAGAEAVAGDEQLPAGQVLSLLEALGEMSMIQALPAAEGELRCRMLETLREYALEQLAERGEVEAMQRRHALHFLALAERAEPELRGPAARSWLDRLDADYDNLRAALQWTQARGEPELGLRLAVALHSLWAMRDHQRDGYRWLTELLRAAGAGVPGRVRGRALIAAASLAAFFGENALVETFAGEGLAIAEALGDQSMRGWGLLQLGRSATQQGRLAKALTFLEGSLEQFVAVGDQFGRAQALAAIAYAYFERPEVVRYYSESLALARASGYDEISSYAVTKLGEFAAARGEFELAEAHIREGIAFAHSLRHLFMLAGAQYSLVKLALARGQLAEARALCDECCDMARKQNDLGLVVLTLGVLGRIDQWQGDPEPARQRHLECLALLGESFANYRSRVTAMLGKLAEAAGDLTGAAAYHTESLELYRGNEDRVGVAWAQRNLACVRLAQGARPAAAQLLCASLAGLLQAEGGHDARRYHVAVSCLSAAAELLEQGSPHHAALLWGAAEVLQERFPPNAVWYECQPADRPRVVAAHGRLATGAHAPDWASGRARTLDEVLDRALHLLLHHAEQP